MNDDTLVPKLKPHPEKQSARWMLVLFGAAAAMAPLLYWFLSLRTRDPFSVIATYRYGDIEYFPLAHALAQGRVGESSIYELAGTGLHSFPFFSIAPHALMIGLFGPIGWPVADALVGVAFFLAVAALLKAAGVMPPVREIAALAVICGFRRRLSDSVISVRTGRLIALPMIDYRFPRPFVSAVVQVFAIALLVEFVRKRGGTWRRWAGMGLVLGVLIQMNIYAAIPMGMAAGLAFLWIIWQARRETGRLKILVGRAALLGIAMALVLTPFFVQRVAEGPDLPARLGIMRVSRSLVLSLGWLPRRDLREVVAALPGVALAIILVKDRARQTALLWIGILLILTLLALPAMVLLTGKVVQIYHFPYEVESLSQMVWLILACLAAQGIGRKLLATIPWVKKQPKIISIVALGFFIGLNLFMAGRFHLPAVKNQLHMRATVEPYSQFPDYRKDFTELVRELGKDSYKQCMVMSTLDHQVMSWWLTFHGGYVGVADPFLSTQPNAECERRFLQFAKEIGMSEQDLMNLVANTYYFAFWINTDTYELAELHTFDAGVADGTKERQKQLATPSWPILWDCWHIVLPEPERKRFLANFRSLPAKSPDREDLIILTNSTDLENFAPNDQAWKLSFRNKTFRVYVRRMENQMAQK